MFATTSFTHFDLKVRKGDELPDDHPMVTARPDLFTPDPPKAKASAKATKKES